MSPDSGSSTRMHASASGASAIRGECAATCVAAHGCSFTSVENSRKYQFDTVLWILKSVTPWPTQIIYAAIFALHHGAVVPTPLELVGVPLGALMCLTFGMSVCLHRFFSHQAFKTSPLVAFLFGLMGTLTNQGGVLWWASKHNRHHKYCDKPEDPHSWTQSNATYAWFGWMYSEFRTDKPFVPAVFANQSSLCLLDDCFPIVVGSFMYLLVHTLGARAMIWGYWVPTIVCAVATFRFNLRYHPYDPVSEIEKKEAANNKGDVIANLLHHHHHHHDHSDSVPDSNVRKAGTCKARDQPDGMSRHNLEHFLSSVAGEG
ncbi:hypothetical protein B484DRAFT_458329, partial [Ochromonadaceae sp. CCMP2298]